MLEGGRVGGGGKEWVAERNLPCVLQFSDLLAGLSQMVPLRRSRPLVRERSPAWFCTVCLHTPSLSSSWQHPAHRCLSPRLPTCPPQCRERCTPNTVTYNSLITALAQGAQWEKAQEVFEQMRASGCRPDVVTYTALISALEKGGQWRLALEVRRGGGRKAAACCTCCTPAAVVCWW